MKTRSLSYRTDLFVTAFDGVVEDRGRYILARTPSNPGFRWGNYLLYPEPPAADSVASWLADFAREFSGETAPFFCWDRPDGAAGEVDGFVRQGFVVDESTVLTANASSLLVPPRFNRDVVVEPLRSDASWQAAAVTLVRAFGVRAKSLDDLRLFVDRQLLRYRAMQENGKGQWYGAYVGDELAATLGLLQIGDIGRFQLVGTDPRFGRQGVCSTLVYEIARQGLERVDTLVMSADANYHAARVYESVGFRPTEKLVALIRE